MNHPSIPRLASAALAASLASGYSLAYAWGDHDEEEETIPFEVATIYFELNNTDGDLGIHSLIDGDPWKTLEIETPNERENLQIRLRNRLRRQGLTELFFESAEPPFESDEDEPTLTPEQFFRRFPEGIYEVSGRTLEGEELESAVAVTHLMPAPPVIVVGGLPVSEDCDEDPGPMVSAPFDITWDAVTQSHPEIGRTGEPIDLVRYELIVERPDDPEIPFKMTVELGPDVTSFPFPAGLASSEPMKVEVLAREASGNQTATESCFQVN